MVERWIVAPEVVGSIPSSYLLFYFNLLNFYNITSQKLNLLLFLVLNNFLKKTFYLNNFILINEIIWQEGLLIDFLQKKITDNWLKKFVIYSANLFNERLVFDKIIKIYLNYLIWPMHKIFIFEFNNVSNLLFVNIFIFFFFFIFFTLFYIFLILI